MRLYIHTLCILNLVILVSSCACLYLASILISFYLLPSLHLVTDYFGTVPYLILAVGSLLLGISIIGIISTLNKSRVGLAINIIMLVIVFPLQLASIFTSLELRNEIETSILFQMPQPKMYNEMKLYWKDEHIQSKWDNLQRHFQCCGVLHLRTGYLDWDQHRNVNESRHGVPDSCCLIETEDCGDKDSIFSDQQPQEKIFIHGCLAVIKEKLHRDISPVLFTYTASAVVLALITFLVLVLTAAFSAAITRKMRQSNQEKSEGDSDNAQTKTSDGKCLDILDSGILSSSFSSIRTDKYNSSSLPHQCREDRSSVYIVPTAPTGTFV